MAKKTNNKQGLISLEKQDIFTPVDINKMGTSEDVCFGKGYDLSTKECKICGDSELCCIKFSESLGKTRKELENKNNFKDLESLIDMKGAKAYYRKLVRQGLTKKEILDKLQNKFELSREEVRSLYRTFKSK